MSFSQAVRDFLMTQHERKSLPIHPKPMPLVLEMGKFYSVLQQLDEDFSFTDVIPLAKVVHRVESLPKVIATQPNNVISYGVPVLNGYTTSQMKFFNYCGVVVGYRPYFLLSDPSSFLQAYECSSRFTCEVYFNQIVEQLYDDDLKRILNKAPAGEDLCCYSKDDFMDGGVHQRDVRVHYLDQLKGLLTRRDENSGLWPMPYLDGFYLEIDVWHKFIVSQFNCSGLTDNTIQVKMLGNHAEFAVNRDTEGNMFVCIPDNMYHFANDGFSARV